MSKPTNKHPLRYGNQHGEIRFGHIIKEKQFSFLARSGDNAGGRHYIRMRSNGDVKQGQKGSTDMRAPGFININCGEDIRGAKSSDGGKVVNPPAYNLLAQNGDITIAAPHGTIRLSAQNIELIAEGNDGRNGIISLNSNEKIRIESPDVEVTSSVSTKIVSANTVNVVGEGIMNVYGGLMDFADGATALLGSKNGDKISAKAGKLSSSFEDIMRDLPSTVEAAANELKKSGLPGKLKELANSPEIAELTGQMEGMAGEMEGLKSTFEKQAEEMSKKFGGFFKDNL
jgi:hypothetical protein|tara:strand:+ start:788 stop:1645 length:858 start_codon:yes stop_codon:yes gene_type:complete